MDGRVMTEAEAAKAMLKLYRLDQIKRIVNEYCMELFMKPKKKPKC